jgi:hypothetical protein
MNMDFLKAIEEKRKIKVTFNSQSKGIVTRICIPFDFGPSRRNLKENPDRYHMYDLDSPDGKHTLSILPEQLLEIHILDECFDPSEYITWEPNWFVKRDWGTYS